MGAPEITANETGWSITPPVGQALTLNGAQLVKKTATVLFSQFTDGGAAVGTYNLPFTIPVGALYLGTAITNVVGFAGDTSAVLTLGDGSDADRYNAGTPNVFASAEGGVAAGVPSGVLYHDTAKTPKITVTSAADFTSVSAGSVTIEMYYLT